MEKSQDCGGNFSGLLAAQKGTADVVGRGIRGSFTARIGVLARQSRCKGGEVLDRASEVAGRLCALAGQTATTESIGGSPRLSGMA